MAEGHTHSGAFAARLNRLRKKLERQAKNAKIIPQGLKPSFIIIQLRHD
jgi:hypothetical protein